jgi:hypothetical protein
MPRWWQGIFHVLAKINVWWHCYATFLALNATMVAGNLPRVGKKKRMVALLCHLFGIECHAVARIFHEVAKLNVWWHCYVTFVALNATRWHGICHVLAKINVEWHCYATFLALICHKGGTEI